MINSIRTAFKENLKDLAWMDPETRLLAMEKADAITDMIGESSAEWCLNWSEFL
jgi:membrane metallo-endopeptidase-like protein 1